MHVVSFTPVKMNNERVPGKNTKLFDDGTPLIKCILDTLGQCKNIAQSYVYCSNEDIRGYLPQNVSFLKRDPKFDTDHANVNQMFRSFAEKVPADIYVLAHATAPFLTSATIDKGIDIVKEGVYDSALTVCRSHDFLWKDNAPLNYDTLLIPRSQDLPPIYIETTGLYIFTRDVIMNRQSKIGYKPFMLEVSDIEAVDINTPFDFKFANMLHMERQGGGHKE